MKPPSAIIATEAVMTQQSVVLILKLIANASTSFATIIRYSGTIIGRVG